MTLRSTAAIILMGLACWPALGGEQLLQNPGFETVTQGMPQHWVPFVQPKDGAFARSSTIAHVGQRSVMLHTPTDYDKEPVNNWSQNLMQPLGGYTVSVQGAIRTEEAGEAVLWIQCWRKQPWGVIKYATSTDTQLITGTTDWQTVKFDVAIPTGTDFLTMRCVLLGTGTAWFDDIQIHAQGDEAETKDKTKKTEAKKPKKKKKALTPSLQESTSEAAPPTKVQIVNPSSSADVDLARLMESLQSEFLGLKITNEELMRVILRLESENINLIDEILLLREEVLELKSQVDGKTPRGVALPPPLVPHGVDWREE